MNMISLPRPECPYCHEAMRRWPLGQHMLVCDTCRRPIVRYLAAPSRRIFRLRPLYSVINAIALIVLIGMIGGNDTYFEAALLLAMVGFVSTIAYCKFVLRGDIVE